jgi:two-component system chemotaxis sensor kinase CheA
MNRSESAMSSEYKALFLEELEEQLQLMDEEILKLEQAGDSEEVVQSLFRAAHTLKGSSAAMGYEKMKQVTHEMERLLEQVRSKLMEVSSSLIDLLFHALDCLKQLKTDIVQNDSTDTDISVCLRDLKAFNGSPKSGETAAAITNYSKPALNLDTRLKVNDAQDQGLQVYWIQVQIAADCVIKGARCYVIQSNLIEWGDVLLAAPDIDGIEEQINQPLDVTFLYSGIQTSAELEASISDLIDVKSVKVLTVDMEETVMINPAANKAVAEKQSNDDNAAAVKQSKSQTVRVSVERLEHLMNLVGELVIDQTRIEEVERIQSRRLKDESVTELGQISDHLSRIIGELQESVMKTRMLPIEQLFNRFPRMIRDLSRDLGKEIELLIEGKDTELDRNLIEEIADPLIHLIRNAVDHGIETPEKREAAGKIAKGTLKLRAAHEDNQIVMYVQDDGAGIDPVKMKKSAMAKGILSAEEAEQLTDREAIELIFRPGFSTASIVSDVSGRGVGMDIVKSHIQKLNGLIDIDTSLGQGTTFKIKLPLTLAIIVGLLVKLNEQTFIIPMSNIAEIVRVTYDDIKQVNGHPVILLRNQVIPVAWMHDHFHIPKTEDKKRPIPLVIVGSAEKRLALAVDELVGNQEIVIKSLGAYVGKVDCIAGATILGDGNVALILEITGLIKKNDKK